MSKSLTPSLVVGAIAVGALLPAAASATPSPSDVRNAAQECRLERGTTAESRQAFSQKYGTNANRRNAFGRCVSQKAREYEKPSPTRSDVRNAAQDCRVEQGTTNESRQAFRVKYGTNANGRNAFGRCVSAKARAAAEARQAAKRACLIERGSTVESRTAFEQKYSAGDNPLKVCVAVRLAS